jgi:hypothetical protein
MTNLYSAYKIGRQLALRKFAEEVTDSSDSAEHLSAALDELLDNKSTKQVDSNVLESTERASMATWGDKMELETPKNTGINV